MAEQPPRGASDPDFVGETAEELYENAPCGYLSALPDGTILRANRTFFGWTGFAAHEVVGKRFQELLTVGGRIFYETHFAPLVAMQGALEEIQLDFRHAGGGTVPVLVNVLQRPAEGTRPALLRITVFNIRDRKRFEAELIAERKRAEQASEAKAEFLSLISHEIRTPMTAILGIAGLLRKTELSPKQLRYVRMLQSASDNLLTLLNNVLDFSKLDAGKAQLLEESFDMRELVFSAVYPHTGRVEEKGLQLQVSFDDGMPARLFGDGPRIGQVVTNLVANAVKFTDQGSVRVHVRVLDRREGSVSLRVSVSDTGIGISDEARARVFDAFAQASEEVGRRFGGTGLGLAISTRVLALYGSRLELDSAVGRGSTFHFDLTLKIAPAIAPVVPLSTGEHAPLEGLRVLVVEDDDVNVFILEQLLSRWGVVYDLARDGAEAVARVRARDYDVVLMDLRMPKMDGYEATETIRALPDPKYRLLPILAVTASTRIGLDERLAKSGFNDALGKPFKPNELVEKLRPYADKRARDRDAGG